MNAAARPLCLNRLLRPLALMVLESILAVTQISAGDLHGRVKVGGLGAFSKEDALDATLGERNRTDAVGDLRLTWEPRWDQWQFVAHYQLTGHAGGAVRLMNAETDYFPRIPPATLFDLSDTIVNGGNRVVTQKLDRLSIGYSAPNFVVRVGRQALTWGSGIIFHPMDLIDPFAPYTVDTEYKPGVDMAYVQWLFHDGSDLQFVAAPRAASDDSRVAANGSTFALSYHRTVRSLGLTLLCARDHGDWTTGLGLSGSLGGAVWNAEVVPTVERHGRARASALFNVSDAKRIADRNATLFAEYFHNGFGIEGSGFGYDTLPTGLTDRLARGQLFNTSRDYLSGGMTLEWTPLVTLSESIIANLNDGSLYAASEANWSVTGNDNLIFGVQVPIGGEGSEFGGRPLSDGSPSNIAPATLLYAQLRHHF